MTFVRVVRVVTVVTVMTVVTVLKDVTKLNFQQNTSLKKEEEKKISQIFFLHLKLFSPRNSKCDKTQKLKMLQNSKTQNVRITQKLKM